MEDTPITLTVPAAAPMRIIQTDSRIPRRPAWIVLPAATHLICISKEEPEGQQILRNLHLRGCLMKLILGMAPRFEGVQFVCGMLQRIADTLAEKQRPPVERTNLPKWTGSNIVRAWQNHQSESLLLSVVVDVIEIVLAEGHVKATTQRLPGCWAL